MHGAGGGGSAVRMCCACFLGDVQYTTSCPVLLPPPPCSFWPATVAYPVAMYIRKHRPTGRRLWTLRALDWACLLVSIFAVVGSVRRWVRGAGRSRELGDARRCGGKQVWEGDVGAHARVRRPPRHAWMCSRLLCPACRSLFPSSTHYDALDSTVSPDQVYADVMNR